MRLINADAFIEENKEIIDCEIDHPKYQDTLRELIDNAPTIERPRGEWIFTGRYNVYGGTEIECSNCHAKLMVSMSRWEFGENFCDVCGSQNKEGGRA